MAKKTASYYVELLMKIKESKTHAEAISIACMGLDTDPPSRPKGGWWKILKRK